MAAESQPKRAPELLRDSAWLHKHPSDLWNEFLDEMCARDCEVSYAPKPSGDEILAAFRGWVVGRYSVALTRGEVWGEDWFLRERGICDIEAHFLVWKTPSRKRPRDE